MKNNIECLENSFFAVCPIGLEQMLESEIQELKIDNYKVKKGGIEFSTDLLKTIEFILKSRISSRVFKQLYRFEIITEKDLYFMSCEIPWKEWITPEETFKITPAQNRSENGKKWSKFKSPIFLSQRLKDAMVDQLRKDFDGERPSVDKEMPDLAILLQVEPNNLENSDKELVTVSLDMCGRSLHERDYRRSRSFTAPLKENLAAGILKLAEYDNQTLIDPMCGSGTLIIEAMLIRGDIPPSFNRVIDYLEYQEKCWDFQAHPYFLKDSSLQGQVLELLKNINLQTVQGFKKLKDQKPKFIANDISIESIKQFIENLRGIGVQELVQIENQDATKLKLSQEDLENAIVITNPPYGERLGDKEQLDQLYYEFGENLKNNFKGINAYILAGELSHLKKISLRTSRKFILFNGGIETRLAKYELY